MDCNSQSKINYQTTSAFGDHINSAIKLPAACVCVCMSIIPPPQAMKRAEQYQKQYYRAEEDRRQALATSEALTALWQKKFEKAQTENHDLRWGLLL